jgi:hypothetical protein
LTTVPSVSDANGLDELISGFCCSRNDLGMFEYTELRGNVWALLKDRRAISEIVTLNKSQKRI